MYNLIYIAGYGRSGSTLLDRLLGTSQEVFSTGEIVHFTDVCLDKYLSVCGCGKQQTECDFWSDIINKMKGFIKNNGGKEFFYKLIKKAEGLESFVQPLDLEEKNIYLKYHKKLFDLIYQKTNAKYIVDSSKTAWKNFNRINLLSEIYPEIKIIHIKREPLAVAYSNIRNYNGSDYRNTVLKREYIFIKSLVSYKFANYMAFKHKKKNNYMFIQYENLITHLDEELNKINEFLDLSSKINVEKINEKNHIFTGNASRFKKIEKIKLDNEYKNHINTLEKMFLKLLGL